MCRTGANQWITVACLVSAAITAPALGAGLLIADGGFGGVLEIEEHAVNVTINNGVAVTEVTQVFRNTERRQVEALYTFPVPNGASVANFSMWINGKEMIGEVVEKDRARRIYESYKQTRRDPGLLEQTDFKTFEMRIFPIGPDAEQRVQISYYQELDVDHDRVTYVYPLATATRSDVDSRTRGRFALTLNARSEVPIVEMDSPSHPNDFVVAEHGDRYYQAGLEVDGGDLSRDIVLSYHLSRPHTGIDIITSRQAGEDGYFMLTLTAGEELKALGVGADYIFILDISGSMTNHGKLRVSRDSIAAFIGTLGEADRFEVITFNIAANTLFGSLQAVGSDTRTKAAEFLGSQQARGGTMLRPALQAAYRYGDSDRPLNLVILSDGITEQSDRSSLIELIGQRPGNARVFCVGVGNEVNRPLLSQMAEDAGGLAAFLSPEDDFDRQADAFRRKLTRPVATGLRIDIDGADVYDVEPRQLPNLYHGAPVRLFGRYRKDATAEVCLHAEVAGTVLDKAINVELPRVDDRNPEIERMWAWHRMDRLLKEGDRSGSRSGVIDEIVRLGEGYSIVSEYTSFIVLENDAEYQRWRIDRRNLLRIQRDRKGQEQLLARLESMRDQAANNVGPDDRTADSASTSPNITPPQQFVRVEERPPAQPASRGFNIDLAPDGGSGGNGGGAIDPITATAALVLGGLAFGSRRRRRGLS